MNAWRAMPERHGAEREFLPSRAKVPLPWAGSLPAMAALAQSYIPWWCSAARHNAPRNGKDAAILPDLSEQMPGAEKPGHRPPRSQRPILAHVNCENAEKAKTTLPEFLPATAWQCDAPSGHG